jgi:hypothetical protein
MGQCDPGVDLLCRTYTSQAGPVPFCCFCPIGCASPKRLGCAKSRAASVKHSTQDPANWLISQLHRCSMSRGAALDQLIGTAEIPSAVAPAPAAPHSGRLLPVELGPSGRSLGFRRVGAGGAEMGQQRLSDLAAAPIGISTVESASARLAVVPAR